MELILPNQITLDDASVKSIEDVAETARLVNEHRPLDSGVLDRIQDELLGDRVFSSNAIEGNTLDRRETVTILKTGQIDVGRKREATEVRNLGEAIGVVSSVVSGDTGCYSAETLLRIHKTLLRDIDDTWAGRYRAHRVMIAGAVHQPPVCEEVSDLVEQVMAVLRDRNERDGSTIEIAAWAHWAIARIHPFHDGNGRMARLWQDLVLFRGRLTCAIIRPQDRQEYLDALGSADEGDFNPVVQLVAQRVLMTFDRYLAEIRRDRELGKWARELAGEADERIDQARQVAYARWSRRMEQLRSMFEVCAANINEASQEIGVQVRKYDLVDRQRWDNIRTGIGASRTWFFSVDIRRAARRVRYIFFFGKHFVSEVDNDQERSEQRVTLLISEGEVGGEAVRLDQLDSPIGMREIFVVEDHFVRVRREPGEHDMVYDRGKSAMQIAQDFLRDVVLQRLS